MFGNISRFASDIWPTPVADAYLRLKIKYFQYSPAITHTIILGFTNLIDDYKSRLSSVCHI